ncbi:MAG TPA: hypothetical protein VL856_04250, partial [Acidimicrobiia bacterium]|nr:hypothetical protein [Acidimicrobiia bacterium]
MTVLGRERLDVDGAARDAEAGGDDALERGERHAAVFHGLELGVQFERDAVLGVHLDSCGVAFGLELRAVTDVDVLRFDVPEAVLAT